MADTGLRAALLETIGGLMATDQVMDWLKFREREHIGGWLIKQGWQKAHYNAFLKIVPRLREAEQRSRWKHLKWLTSLDFTWLSLLYRFLPLELSLPYRFLLNWAYPTGFPPENFQHSFDVILVKLCVVNCDLFCREMEPFQCDSWLLFSWNSTLMSTGAQMLLGTDSWNL